MYTLCFILLICISVLTCRLVRLYVSKDIQEVTPSTLRGFEHSTASYLILPSHRHRQALRRMRHLHWHSLARSRVSRHRIRQWPNLWTSYCFTTNPYPNSTSACRDSLVTTPQTSLLTALGESELPKHEIRLLQCIHMCVYIYMYIHSKRVLTYPACVMY